VQEAIDMHVAMGRRTNSAIRCVGISVNTSKLDAGRRGDYLRDLSAATGLPCIDPLIDGCGAIVESIRKFYPA